MLLQKYFYRLGTVNSKLFAGKDFLRNKWKYELTVHFKHEMIGKHLTGTLIKVGLRINRVRINCARNTQKLHVEIMPMRFSVKRMYGGGGEGMLVGKPIWPILLKTRM